MTNYVLWVHGSKYSHTWSTIITLVCSIETFESFKSRGDKKDKIWNVLHVSGNIPDVLIS